jgi:hypothetical protein
VLVLRSSSDGDKNLVHSSRSKGCFDKIGNCDGSNKRRLSYSLHTNLAISPFYSLAPYLIT